MDDGPAIDATSSDAAADRGVPHPTRRGRRRVVITLVVLLTLVAVAFVGELGWAYLKFRSIDRIAAGRMDDGTSSTLPGPVTTVKVPANGVGGPGVPSAAESGPQLDTSGIVPFGGPSARNILVVGTDSRADIPDDQKSSFGDVAGERTDTIMILRVDRATDRAWVLSLPRDTWVRIAGTRRWDRINSAYEKGPSVLADTIRENFGIPIWHMVKVDFVGFQKVVSALGGVRICFPLPSRDRMSGLAQEPGCNILDETQATAYVRSRHLEELRHGVWVTDPRSDLGRIARQQLFLRAAMRRAIEHGVRNPVVLNAMLSELKGAVAIDDTFDFSEVIGLANDFRSFDPDQLGAFTLPEDDRRIDGKAVLVVRPSEARTVAGRFGRR